MKHLTILLAAGVLFAGAQAVEAAITDLNTLDALTTGNHSFTADSQTFDAYVHNDSGTGWPSFWKALPDAIGTKPDRTIWGVHTECHCRRCGSHLGHIFDDGPKPTGKRHCINGVSLVFHPA